MIKNQVFILLFSVLFFAHSNGQESSNSILNGFFEPAYFGKPLICEIHSTMSKVELGYSKSYAEFDLLEEKAKFQRPVVEVHLGMDAPFYAQYFGTLGNEPKWGIAMSLPLSIHVLEDMWGPETAPVINTDYRFGSPRIRAIRYFSGHKFLKNMSVSWLPMFHECTHLGDEITIYRKDENFPITRINVSYEYTELQFTINDPEKSRENIQTFRFGGQYRLSDRGLGWFSVRQDAELTQAIDLKASTKRHELYIQYQYQRTKGFLAGKRVMNIFSVEARNRLRYGIPMFKKDLNGNWMTTYLNERMFWNFNVYLGYKFYPKSNANNSIDLMLHFYRGINPYGQLRNYPSYPFFGISIAYEP